MQKVILASQSKNRQKLLKELGIPFMVVVSDFDEEKIKEKNHSIRAKKIALAKAQQVAKKHKGIIISCDTFKKISCYHLGSGLCCFRTLCNGAY